MRAKWICILILLIAGWSVCYAEVQADGSEEGIPSLVGHWIVNAHGGVLSKEKVVSPYTHHEGRFSDLTADMNITEQKGRVFYGEFSSSRGLNETILGVIGLDNKSIRLVDMDGLTQGELISPDLIQVIYTQITNNESVIAAGTWERIP